MKNSTTLNISDRFDNISTLISAKVRDLEIADSRLIDAKAKLEEKQTEVEEWKQAQWVLQEAAKTVQNVIHDQICEVVTTCIRTIFPEYDYTFNIEFISKRGKTEARLYLKDGDNELDPTEAGSLGVCDVACLALRIAVLKLHTPALAPVLILDEPFRWLQKSKRPAMAALIESLADEMGIQVILATHDEEYEVGRIIDISSIT